MKKSTTAVLAGTAGLALAAGTLIAPLSSATATRGHDGHRGHHQSHSAIGLTDDGQLVRFKLSKARHADAVGPVTGLQGDTELVGIDFRVQDGKLYGVGDQGGVYTIDTGTAAATKVSQLTVPLQGEDFGVDFNPAADRLRVVSDTSQNLRHDVNPGGATIADGPLTTPPATTPTTGVTAAAYTNNDLAPATATTLFDLNTTTDQVMIQSPANSGQLAATGAFGVDAAPDAGFDIYSDLRSGRTVTNTGWATLTTAGEATLYEVNLTTGEVSRHGTFPRSLQVTDLAVHLDTGR